MENKALDREKAREYINKLLPPKPMVVLEPKRADGITVFDSKLGGVPYMPREFEYPKGKSGAYEGRPLRLLAQLNFEKLPHIEDFPEKGILQFFCSDDFNEMVLGLDFEDSTSQNGFRVIYHENIITDESKLISEEDISGYFSEDNPEYFFAGEDGPFPFMGEFLLVPKQPEMCIADLSDHKAEKAFMKYLSNAIGEELHSFEDIFNSKHWNELEGLYNEFADLETNEHTCIGGYPYFTQEDPRGHDDDISDLDMLLFQSASHFWDDTNDEIMWSDAGVANFFIKREDLKNLDFSKVAYNWDCC